MELYLLHLRANDYGKQPSEILLIESDVVAYAFDKWCGLYGRKVDNLLAEKKEVKKNGQVVGHKPKYDLEDALAKAANDKRSRLRGFAEILAELDTPGVTKIVR